MTTQHSKQMRSLLSVSLVVALAGCNSTSAKLKFAEVATASTLIVALPLVPVAQAYHFLSGDIREQRAKVAALKDILDPVYEERVRMIKSRDPAADARRVVAEGCDLLLASVPNGVVYPGYLHTGIPAKFASKPIISPKSPTYRFLEELMTQDKLESESAQHGVYYSGGMAFITAGFSYKERFNREMVRLSGKEPISAPKPTAEN